MYFLPACSAARRQAQPKSPVYFSTDFGAKCDGSTDDTTALRALVAASAALGVTVELVPRGLTCLTQSLPIKSNTHVRIDGTLKSVSGVKSNLLANDSFVRQTGGPYETNVVIEGDGTIDNGMVGGVGTGAAQAAVSCIAGLGPVSGWTINDLTVQNCGSWPINFNGSSAYINGGSPTSLATHIQVNRTKMLNGSNSSEFTNCFDCHFNHTYSYNINDYGLSFYGNCQTCSAEFTTTDLTAGAISVLADGDATATPVQPNAVPSVDILVLGGTGTRSTGPAIYVAQTAANTTKKHQNIRVIGFSGSRNNTSNGAFYGGLTVFNTDGVTSIGNSWDHDGPTSGTNGTICGEAYNNTVSNLTSIGATVRDEGGNGGTGAAAVGICFLGAGPTNPNIQGLKVIDDQATHTMAYAVNGAVTGGAGSVSMITASGLTGSTFGPQFVQGAILQIANQGADTYLPQNFFPVNIQASGGISATGAATSARVATTGPFTTGPTIDQRGASVTAVAAAASAAIGGTVQGGSFAVADISTGNTALYIGDAATGFVLVGGNAEWVASTTSPASGKSSLASDGTNIRIYNGTGSSQNYRAVATATR